MIGRPQVKTLNYIRSKDAKHAEALDDIATAISVLPSFADHETPQGPINGANKIFYLANAPNPASSLHLFLTAAGSSVLLQQGKDYSISGNALTLTAAPAVNSVLSASYRY